MSKRVTITITNQEDGSVINIDAEGYALLALKERTEDGFNGSTGLDGVSAKDVAMMITRMEKDYPEIRKATLAQKVGNVLGGIFAEMAGEDDDCDCENCTARRAKEAAEAQDEPTTK